MGETDGTGGIVTMDHMNQLVKTEMLKLENGTGGIVGDGRRFGSLSTMKLMMLKLENQVPYEDLEASFNSLKVKPASANGSLNHFAINYYADFLTRECRKQWLQSVASQGKFDHLLHLVHSCATVLAPDEHCILVVDDTDPCIVLLPSANFLATESRIKFRATNDGSQFGMYFKQGGVMEFSPFLLTESNINLNLNLIAFEQSLPAEDNVKRPVTAYFMALGNLIRSGEDLELLQRSGIVDYAIGREEALDFFSGKVLKAIPDYRGNYNAHLKPFVAGVRNYCDNPSRKRIIALKHLCTLKNLKAFITVVVGVLVLNSIQTGFTIKSAT